MRTISFFGQYLDSTNTGLKGILTVRERLQRGICLAVFDGIGGGHFGEIAAYEAAHSLSVSPPPAPLFAKNCEKMLAELCRQMSDAVVSKANDLLTDHMGSTLVALYFSAVSLRRFL